jgi:aryl-alcohol dehydrogenase-like predicted oxidoreductase
MDLGADRSVETLRARSHALLDAAYRAGVRNVDAARSYGRSEEFVGARLSARGLAPAEVTIGPSEATATRVNGGSMQTPPGRVLVATDEPQPGLDAHA